MHARMYIHTHTHTHTYIYIYICIDKTNRTASVEDALPKIATLGERTVRMDEIKCTRNSVPIKNTTIAATTELTRKTPRGYKNSAIYTISCNRVHRFSRLRQTHTICVAAHNTRCSGILSLWNRNIALSSESKKHRRHALRYHDEKESRSTSCLHTHTQSHAHKHGSTGSRAVHG